MILRAALFVLAMGAVGVHAAVADDLERTARDAVATKHFREAASVYSRLSEREPGNADYLVWIGRLLSWMQDYPAAIDTLSKAIAIRPDRADLFIARAGIEERLMRFDDAGADYEKIYQLAYRSPQWMEKVSMMRARQGKTGETVAALEAAYKLDRDNYELAYFLGETHFNEGETEQALANALQAALKSKRTTVIGVRIDASGYVAQFNALREL